MVVLSWTTDPVSAQQPLPGGGNAGMASDGGVAGDDGNTGVSAASSVASVSGLVVGVFSLPARAQCETTRRALRRAGIPSAEVRLDQAPEAREELREVGFSSAPVVVTPDAAWSGFRPDLLRGLEISWKEEEL